MTIRGRLRGPEVTEVNEDGSFTVTAPGMGEPVFTGGQAEGPAEVCSAFEADLS